MSDERASDSEIDLYERAYQREKRARQRAEQLLEDNSRELYLKQKDVERAAAALKRNQQELVQAEKGVAMGTLVAGVIHEINNPLAFITSNFRYLQRQLLDIVEVNDLDPVRVGKAQEVIIDIHEGLKRIEQTVTNLRNYTHSSFQNFSEVDLNKVLQISIDQSRPRMQEGTRVSYHPADGCRVMGNENQLIQVFTNLILNAAQSKPEPVDILVEIEAAPSEVIAHIQDNGGGMSEAVLEKIFDPFFTTKEIGDGSGMGLPVVAGIVEGHSGRITVETEVDEGTVFSVSLPRL